MDVFGVNEDFYYSTLPFLVKNIRRGMTIIAFADKLNDDQKIQLIKENEDF